MRSCTHLFRRMIALMWATLPFTGASGQAYRPPGRIVLPLNSGWQFELAQDSATYPPAYPGNGWQPVTLPHDWSISGPFAKTNPTTTQEAALPAGVGWYHKVFQLPLAYQGEKVFIDFGGVYRDSKVWINGHLLGERPNGSISFRYGMTRYLRFGAASNTLVVQVDNSLQPNARWYTGSGILRPVRLVITGDIAVAHWGTFVTTRPAKNGSAAVLLETKIRHGETPLRQIAVETTLYDSAGRAVARAKTPAFLPADTTTRILQRLLVSRPQRWSIDRPYLYRALTRLYARDSLLDTYSTVVGIRYFRWDTDSGFYLNGKHLPIRGVCLHDDLGALGAAANEAAIRRRLRLLKAMGCNAIRTAHNPPAPMLLDVADQMGFLVMDEAFDVWKRKKVRYDYHLYWDQWHRRDLTDQVLRDRNHPSVFVWSIGNEIPDQFDSAGAPIARELADLVRSLDTTRPVTSALTETDSARNFIYRSGALDLIGVNYHDTLYPKLRALFPGKPLIATETTSALESRGDYNMPSDRAARWPAAYKAPFKGNPDYTISAYDNRFAYWGSTHEQTLLALRNYPYIAGLFVWSGFDYLGEPTPYPWPARSAYFGILDLAGFPKDAYYLYQSQWTHRPVLHLLPHWNWKKGDTVDVWAYYNDADCVELFVNGRSAGTRKATPGALHAMWRVPFTPGTLRAVSTLRGKVVLSRDIRTAGKPAALAAKADRTHLRADGRDLSFITVCIKDASGTPVPDAAEPVAFTIQGPAVLAGTNNGYQADLESFQSNPHRAYHGLVLGIIHTTGTPGKITVRITSPGLQTAKIELESFPLTPKP